MAQPERQGTGGGFTMGGNNNRPILVFLSIGMVSGFLASLLVGGNGLVAGLLAGIIGSFVGGYLFQALRIDLGIRNELVRQIVTATIGAIIVVVIARFIAG